MKIDLDLETINVALDAIETARYNIKLVDGVRAASNYSFKVERARKVLEAAKGGMQKELQEEDLRDNKPYPYSFW